MRKRNSVLRYATYKETARTIVHERIHYFNQSYQLTFNKIFIKNHTKRWGSCSSKKNLNFNYKLVFLPESLRDYLIVHELCHLQEMNHSQQFWELVGKTIPHYKILNKKLKTWRM